MPERDPEATFVGYVGSVSGGVVHVRLRDSPSTLVMVGGESYRVGQIGAFLRIPLGYTHLYGVCTQVGASAAPGQQDTDSLTVLEANQEPTPEGYRWLTLSLFGESVGGHFDRGVGQYPTIGDEVHLVTSEDLRVIYGAGVQDDAVTIGRIAGATGIPAWLQVSSIVSRHACIVGSTGSGKSNLVAVLLDALTAGDYPSARILVIDPHGEYGTSIGERGKLIRTGPSLPDGTGRLRVPYWALSFDELVTITMGALPPLQVESIRDRVRDLKLEAAQLLPSPPPLEAVTADTPIPFSIRRLWFELEDVERSTFDQSNAQTQETKLTPEEPGDAEQLIAPRYPAASPYNQAPYFNKQRRGIGRQLDLLRTRLLDNRFAFMFDPDDPLHPDFDGRVEADLDGLVADWVGGPEPVTVLDVSGIPADVIGIVVGTMMSIVYEALFWAMELDVGGRRQPLLVILDEAHQFLPKDADTPAHRMFSKVAREGRKYGIGMVAVTQRPSDIDPGVLSQCGTTIALRVTNGEDRRAVAGTIPDDLGGLIALLPSLRTGEALVLGDALQVPSRVRVRKATRKPIGDDPPLPQAWQRPERPALTGYGDAIRNWRAQSTSAPIPSLSEDT